MDKGEKMGGGLRGGGRGETAKNSEKFHHEKKIIPLP